MAKKKEEEIQVQKFHVYDFLIRTKLIRSQQEIIMKKYENYGLKTLQEWEDLTGKPILEIFK